MFITFPEILTGTESPKSNESSKNHRLYSRFFYYSSRFTLWSGGTTNFGTRSLITLLRIVDEVDYEVSHKYLPQPVQGKSPICLECHRTPVHPTKKSLLEDTKIKYICIDVNKLSLDTQDVVGFVPEGETS